jgi:GLPGLI family protein
MLPVPKGYCGDINKEEIKMKYKINNINMKISGNILSLILCLLAGCDMMYAQIEQYSGIMRLLENTKVLDSANMRITYSLAFVADSSKPNEKWNDRKILLIGNSIQHCYSYYARFRDSTITANAKKEDPKPIKLDGFPSGVCAEWYDIYNNFPVGKQTAIENITNFQIAVYKENLMDIKWNITADTMTITGYHCYKAVCRYHGRNWIAWFTLDIPINAGPWKLHGLPGLILKAYDDRQHYVFECIGIEKLKHREPILMYGMRMVYEAASSATHTGTREGYLTALRRFYENYVNSHLSMGCDVYITDDSGNIIEHIETPNTKFAELNVGFSIRVNARDRYRKIPYNPIELE